jgi:phage protein D
LGFKDQVADALEEKAMEKAKKQVQKLRASDSAPEGAFMHPSFLINLGKTELSSEKKSGVVSLRVARSIGLPIDLCEIFLDNTEEHFEKGEALKVQLGYDKKLETVFSGSVVEVEDRLSGVMKITALGPASRLLLLRLNRVYLSQTAGKIVRDLAGEVKLKVKTASDGINLPAFVIDEATNAFEHILKLAERCNFDVYVTEDEELIFKERGGGKNTMLRFGKDIIRYEEFSFSPLYTSAKIYGESPSSIKGTDTSHWLTKQEVKGEAGSGAPLLILDPAVKDKKTAESVAKARMERLKYSKGALFVTVGKPEIKLGDTVSSDRTTGDLEVRSIEHCLSKIKGFTTAINCIMAG